MPKVADDWQPDQNLFYIHFSRNCNEGATGGYGDIKDAEEKASKMMARGYKTSIMFCTFNDIMGASTQELQQKVDEYERLVNEVGDVVELQLKDIKISEN